MRKFAAMLLLVTGAAAPAFGGSVLEFEECRALFEATEHPLNDEIHLSEQVRDFLANAPEELFIAIGSMFLAEIPPITDPHLVHEFRNYFGPDWAEMMRRKTILEASRLLVTAAEWEQICPYFLNSELVDFIARALTRLKAGQVSPQRLKPNEMRRRLRAHLLQHLDEIPSYERMLAHTSLQAAFTEVFKASLMSYAVNLATPSMQQSMARMLRDGKLGDPITFIEGWVAVLFQRMRGEAPPPTTFAELQSRSAPSQPGFFEQLSGLETPIRSFLYKAMMWAQVEMPSYNGSQVRRAIVEALDEHDQIIEELSRLHFQQQTELNRMTAEFAFHAPERSRPDAKKPTHEFNQFAQEEVPIEQLRPNRDYAVQFVREIGHRCRVQRVRFTERAITGLRSSKLTTGVAPSAWLKAIQLGPAACHNSDGIKLLQISPLRSFGQMNIEVKKRTTPWRLYGYRDQTGRFVFDLFLQNK